VEIPKSYKKFNTIKNLHWSLLDDILFSAVAGTMDYYLVMRMFKKYKPDPNHFIPNTAKNIIIHVGDNHAKIYRKILSNLSFKMTEKAHRKSDNCVMIKSDNKVLVRYPLFQPTSNVSYGGNAVYLIGLCMYMSKMIVIIILLIVILYLFIDIIKMTTCFFFTHTDLKEDLVNSTRCMPLHV
jgi:hypothetical protein